MLRIASIKADETDGEYDDFYLLVSAGGPLGTKDVKVRISGQSYVDIYEALRETGSIPKQ